MRVLSLLLCTIAVTHAANLRRLRNLSSEESVPTITAQYLDLAGEVDTETIHRLIAKRKELEERDRAAGGNENDTTQRDLQRDTFAAQNERHLINRELQDSMSMASMSLGLRLSMSLSMSM